MNHLAILPKSLKRFPYSLKLNSRIKLVFRVFIKVIQLPCKSRSLKLKRVFHLNQVELL